MDFLESFSAFSTFLCSIPLITAISCLLIHYLVYSRRVAQWKRSNIPFLKPSFLIGHKYFLNSTKVSYLASIDRIYKENSDKDVVGFFLATMPMVMIRDPALIKQVFVKNFDKTFESGLAGSKHDEVAQNIPSFCVDKSKWKSDRRTLLPMLATSRMSGEAFSKVSRHIVSLLTHVEEVRCKGRPIDVKQVSSNFVIDSVSHSFFGLEANSFKKEGALFEVVRSGNPRVMRMLSTFAQMQFPCFQVFESLKTLTTKQIDSFRSIISQQMQQRNQDNIKENDFVDFLMRLKDGEENEMRGSEIEVTKQMLGFGLSVAFGGVLIWYEIAAQLIFAIHLLSLHPEHQEIIRKEVSRAMKKHNTNEFTYDVVQDLQFTNQCIRETIRLLPGVGPITRMCTEDFKVPGTDYTFKKGERIMINPYSVQRDPAHFQNPDKFDPERFSPENKDAISPDSFLAFGTGPRKCPGYKISFLLMATMIGSLVHKYEIKPRSHLKQMNVTDFHPFSVGGVSKEDIFVDVMPRKIMTQ